MTTKAKPKIQKNVSFTISAKVAKEFFGAAKGFFPEARLRINEKGISYRMVDCANVFIAQVDLTKFESSTLPEKEIEFPTAFAPFERILSVVKPTDPISFTVNKEGTKISIETENTIVSVGRLDGNTIRADPNEKRNFTLDTKATISGERLLEAIRLNNDKEKIILSTEKSGKFVARSECSDSGAEISSRTYLGKTEKGECEVLLDASYMKDIAKKLAKKTISVETRTDHPIRFIAETDGLRIEYLLAPRLHCD